MKKLFEMSMLVAVILFAGFCGRVDARCRARSCCV